MDEVVAGTSYTGCRLVAIAAPHHDAPSSLTHSFLLSVRTIASFIYSIYGYFVCVCVPCGKIGQNWWPPHILCTMQWSNARRQEITHTHFCISFTSAIHLHVVVVVVVGCRLSAMPFTIIFCVFCKQTKENQLCILKGVHHTEHFSAIICLQNRKCIADVYSFARIHILHAHS